MTAPVGEHLRTWRRRRGHTQERLALRAEVSQRHLSAVENGRATPSPELIGHLARTLDIPARDENELLLAAGYAPRRSETPLADLGEVRQALTFMIGAHAPNPAVVVDHRWTLVDANGPALSLFGLLAPDPPLLDGALNVMHLVLHDDGLRSHIRNWDECGPALAHTVADEARRHPDDVVLAELASRFGAATPRTPRRAPTPPGIVTTMRLDTPVGEIALFTCLSVLLGPIDVTASELRLETFFPADAESRRRLVGLAGSVD